MYICGRDIHVQALGRERSWIFVVGERSCIFVVGKRSCIFVVGVSVWPLYHIYH